MIIHSISITILGNIMEIIINGIKYELRAEENGAYVMPNEYKGKVVIPAQIIVDGLVINVIGIAEDAFYRCDDVTSISLPEGIKTIENSAFESISGLTEIVVPASVTSIGKCAFSDCENLREVVLLPQMESIPEDMFESCGSLTTVNIPTSVKILEPGCFSACTSLRDIHLPEGLEKIGMAAFEMCSTLENINIPATVKDIDTRAFGSCSSLKRIVLPEGLEYVPTECFEYCENLQEVVIPASVKMVEEDALVLTPYRKHGIQYSHDLLVAVGRVESESGCLQIKDGIRAVCDSATSDYDNTLKKVVCPSSLRQIGRKAFANSANLSEVVLNEGLEYIDAGAFSDCKNLTEIYIPTTVSRIELGAFAACENLKKIVVSPDNPYFDSRNKCNAIIHTASNTLICACPTTKIPDNIVKIGDLAFAEMSSLKQITIPDTVTRIGWNAFTHCKNLQQVTLPKNLEFIGETAFSYCKKLADIHFPESISTIGFGAFDSTAWFDKQPNGMVIIGSALYKYIPYNEVSEYNSDEVDEEPDCVIPEHVQSISEEAFGQVNQPIRIFLPKNLKSFNPISFSRCYLDNFTIVRPDGVGEDYPFNDNTYHSAWIDGFFFMLDEKEKTASLVISADTKCKDWPNVLPDKVIYDRQAYLVDDDSRIVFRINKGTKKEVADIDRIIDQFIEQQLAEKANR